VATSASDVVVVTNDEAAFYFACADAIPPGVLAAQGDPSGAAAIDVAAAVTTYFPGGCATASTMDGTVTFGLFDCSGPLGLVHGTGTVTAKLVPEGSGELLVQLSGDAVAASGAVFTLNTQAFLTQTADGRRTLRATSMSSGSGPSGTSANHIGSFTMTWPSGGTCATINATFYGVGSGTYGGATETLSDYVICQGGCPQSGLATSIFSQGSVTLHYDGSPYAFCMSNGGTSEALPLECP
jgi:hypothetical protein